MRIVLTILIACVVLPHIANGADDPDEAALVSAGLSHEPSDLLTFIKTRSQTTANPDILKALVADLGQVDPKVSEKAYAGLLMQGPLAVPTLRRAINELQDKSLAERARKCLAAIEGRAGGDLVSAVIRTLAVKKPLGTVEALLEYIPYADDQIVLDVVAVALAKLAYPDDKAHPALRKALESPTPVLRAVAVEALAKNARADMRGILSKLLADPIRVVRLRAGLALARAEDMAAVPVLIETLGELTKVERTPVEELLRNLAGETAPKNTPGTDDEAARKSLRDAWAAWWQKIDGPALVDEFRSRTLHPSERSKVAELVRKLGDNNYRVREKASNDIVAMGAKVMADLRVAAKDMDGERSRRAEAAIARVQQSDSKRVPSGTARLAALRRPEGATEAMIEYLPYADGDDGIVEEIRTALITLAITKDNTPDPAMVAALTHPQPLCRSIVGEALCKGAGVSIRTSIKKLLADPEWSVKQNIAATLVTFGEKDAVPVLIDILGELPATDTWQAQDMLHQLAGEKAPTVMVGDNPADRKKYRDAWADWWKANSDKIELVKLTSTPNYLGYTLLIEVGGNNIGRVTEVDRTGKVRWQVGNLRYPVDAFILPGERVLVTEWDGNRVSEYDFRGNLIWKKDGLAGRTTNAQRLPSGNTFICTTNELMEVDRAGRVVYQIAVPQSLTAAYRAPTGDIVALRNDGKVARYDVKGKELATFPSNRDSSWTSGIDLGRNGSILVTQPSASKVTEYSAAGKALMEWNTPNVTTATMIANGNILAASHGGRTVIELDRTGKKVWEHKSDLSIFRAKRR